MAWRAWRSSTWVAALATTTWPSSGPSRSAASFVEIARRFGKTPQGVRDAAERGRLPRDVVFRGKKKERRFPKPLIDNLDAWPGYGTVPASGSAEDHLTREVERLRAENALLHREVTESAAGRAAAKMRIDELVRTVDRQRMALRVFVDVLSDEGMDLGQIRALLTLGAGERAVRGRHSVVERPRPRSCAPTPERPAPDGAPGKPRQRTEIVDRVTVHQATKACASVRQHGAA